MAQHVSFSLPEARRCLVAARRLPASASASHFALWLELPTLAPPTPVALSIEPMMPPQVPHVVANSTASEEPTGDESAGDTPRVREERWAGVLLLAAVAPLEGAVSSLANTAGEKDARGRSAASPGEAAPPQLLLLRLLLLPLLPPLSLDALLAGSRSGENGEGMKE